MPPVGFEPTISAGERPQTYTLDRAATGTGWSVFTVGIFAISTFRSTSTIHIQYTVSIICTADVLQTLCLVVPGC